jgi:hypothetical protein
MRGTRGHFFRKKPSQVFYQNRLISVQTAYFEFSFRKLFSWKKTCCKLYSINIFRPSFAHLKNGPNFQQILAENKLQLFFGRIFAWVNENLFDLCFSAVIDEFPRYYFSQLLLHSQIRFPENSSLEDSSSEHSSSEILRRRILRLGFFFRMGGKFFVGAFFARNIPRRRILR